MTVCRAKERLQPCLNITKIFAQKIAPEKSERARVPGEGWEQRAEGVNVAFKEPVYKILKRIKNEHYFRWPGEDG